MPTDLLFRADAYERECSATVLDVNERGGIVLDRTVFYAQGGGQPGDKGVIEVGAQPIVIATTVYDQADKGIVVHVPAEGQAQAAAGSTVTAKLDWGTRFARMRIHTALHLLSCVLAYPVTGGAIGEGEGRLDFDIPDAGLDKEELTAKLQALVDRDAKVGQRWITDEELAGNPGLVKTMSVKPPMGSGKVRLVEIEGIDLQPCGGTHVARTSEIGKVRVTAIEKKGKQNRRVRIGLV
ncbi:MAG: alanyl-tRNA editing protein [Hyphomicrobiales bacterium]|nr:alanyl-tRNA editing protein [Hyphomicrobiales bacterium]MBV8766998.1 alanyl-tRNA editing protein [Hyphomicrobiales bacterium]MBV9433724.1 alanyl-tRNA editing protein [Hyphomicrobiales bacterium]MBV9739502.1 alanyl-tRNA editing protein [Hyphomicrobiales bacterium]MBW0002417.1 alanyl-tRNA editing protein [Hyphomicrobiales bacterium]